MIILGIDPGTATTGYGVIEMDGDSCKTLDYGCIRTTPDRSRQDRLKIIHGQMLAILDRWQPDVMAIEQLFFNRNTSTAMVVGEARGVMLLAASMREVSVAEYTPMVVKQALVGYGRASKSQVEDMVQLELGLKKAPKPDDVSDALAIALTHCFLGARLPKAV
ncbi:MAG TPA: crossover junction endodeoxyribonuclease RuvC [Candidatus Xenobia bacterium]|jgi:crossover junction endodeoxyribonuclease RuvC